MPSLFLSLPSDALVSVPGLFQGCCLLSLPQPRLRGNQRCLLWHLMPGGTQGKPRFRVQRGSLLAVPTCGPGQGTASDFRSRVLAARDRCVVDTGHCPAPWVPGEGGPSDAPSTFLHSECLFSLSPSSGRLPCPQQTQDSWSC